ncbi:MAG: hypothetical protein JWO98_5324 [Frankiales bacterium]|nr:hypothetical protein [Frankiales bacterium]
MTPPNGAYDPATLVVAPGFVPYPAAANFMPVSHATLSDLTMPGVLNDLMQLRLAFAAHFGTELTYAEAYRTLYVQTVRKAEQAKGGSLAAIPGTSNHGEGGRAFDFRNTIGTAGSATSNWMIANAPRFGFFRDVPSEYWHYHHPSTTPVTPTYVAPASEGAPAPLIPEPEEETDMFIALLGGTDSFNATDSTGAAVTVKPGDQCLVAPSFIRHIWDGDAYAAIVKPITDSGVVLRTARYDTAQAFGAMWELFSAKSTKANL